MVVASMYHREAILTGRVDMFCLACEEHLRCERDAGAHVAAPRHRDNLRALGYVGAYRGERIRKVKKGYYCEFCNFILATSGRVNLHIGDAKHINNKGMNLLKRVGNDVIANHNICINDLAWNGLIRNTCVICNLEVDDNNVHKNDRDHIINLVQNETQFDGNNNIYRKTAEASFQCLTCNTELAFGNLKRHCDSDEHKNLYSKCLLFNESNTEKSEDRDDVIHQIPEQVKTVDEQTKIETKKPDLKPINKHEKQIKEKPIDRTDLICKRMKAPGFITDVEGKKVCILCEWDIEDANLGRHVTSKHHQTLLKMNMDHMKKKENQSVQGIILAEKATAPLDVDDNDVSDKSKIIEAINKFQQNRVNIDLIASTAYCKVCSKNINYKFDDIESHIEEHKKEPLKKHSTNDPPSFDIDHKEQKVKSKTSLFSRPVHLIKDDDASSRSRSVSSSTSQDDDDDLEAFARQNNITIDRLANLGYCHVCETRVPNSLRNMKQHITGKIHKTNMSQVDITKKHMEDTIVKQPFSEFLETLTTVEFIFGKDVIINDKYCLNLFSFLTFTKAYTKFVCSVCELELYSYEIEKHKNEQKHKDKYMKCFVVTSLDSEFVREIRPGVYHCGYCNMLVEEWDELKSHLNTAEHRESKHSAEWRLQQHMPHVNQNRDLRTMAVAMRLMHLM